MFTDNQVYFFRSLSMRTSQLCAFAEAAQLGLPISYPSQQLCKVSVNGEDIVARYDMLSNQPDDFDEFDDVECLGPAEIHGIKFMSIGEIVEEMRELDLFVPACLLKGRRVGA